MSIRYNGTFPSLTYLCMCQSKDKSCWNISNTLQQFIIIIMLMQIKFQRMNTNSFMYSTFHQTNMIFNRVYSTKLIAANFCPCLQTIPKTHSCMFVPACESVKKLCEVCAGTGGPTAAGDAPEPTGLLALAAQHALQVDRHWLTLLC